MMKRKRMMAKHLYKKFFNIIFSSLFFLLILLNQNVFSKPIPPGSGEGDVPANILILLDSSASMLAELSKSINILAGTSPSPDPGGIGLEKTF